MLKNQFLTVFRNVRKHPGRALINLGGLALGIAAAFVLSLYVRQELTYDRHLADHDRIYRITTDFFEMGGFAKSQEQLLDVLPQAAPEIELATRFDRGFRATPLAVDGRTYEEPHYFFVDSTYFQLFSYRFLEGRAETVMQTPDEAVLSEPLARKLFGSPAAAHGRTLLVGREQTPYRISGVVAAPAGRTHLAAELWLPLEREEPATAWTNIHFYNYVRLRPGATRADLERALDGLLRDHAYPASGSTASFEEWAAGSKAVTFRVQPLTDIYLHSDFGFEITPGGNPVQVYVLGLIGLFILLIAGLNYINLTTAHSTVRAKEVGVKKTLGAARSTLVQQFLSETVVFSLLAMVIAMGLAEVMLAVFAFITGEPLIESLFSSVWHPLALLVFALAAGLAAGLYPAFYLASFRPARVLKGGWRARGNQRLRSTLVVVQFALATALMISSLVVYRQLSFLLETDKGFEHEGVLVVENASALGDRAEAFRRQLAQRPEVRRSSFAGRTPTASGITIYTYQPPEMDEELTLQTFSGDADYLATLGLRLVAGRPFSDEIASDSSAAILNESAVRALGLGEEPLGREINKGQRVIGVVSDFHFQSLRQQIEPVVLVYTPTGRNLVLKLGSANVGAFVTHLTDLWRTFVPDEPIRYAFLDDNFARLAEQEQRLSRAVAFFTILALLIACLGLFGLTAFAVQRRTKEIGIRKVMGASAGGLVALLTRDFLLLVGVAFAVAAPVAYVVMKRWLDDFAYRTELSWTVFAVTAGAALAVVLLTVSFQSIKAALADPVESLRYE